MKHNLQTMTGQNLDRTTDLKEKWYWNGLNSTQNLGCVTYLYKKYNRPETVEEFYNAYTADTATSSTQDLRTYGRSEEYLENVTNTLAENDGNRFEFEDYFSYILKKLFYDTINGAKKETELANLLKSKGYIIKDPTFYEDTKLGVDMFVYKDGKLLFIIQVKPHTFFIGDRNQSLINDRRKALDKEKKCKERFRVPVFYCIYDKQGKWLRNDKGRMCWKLDTLIN